MIRYKIILLFFILLTFASSSYGINPYLTRAVIEGRQTYVSASNFRIPIWRWYGQVGGTGVFRLNFYNDDMSVGFFIVRGYQFQPAIYKLGLQHVYIVEEMGDGRLSKVIHMQFDPLGDVDDFCAELTANHVTNDDLISTTGRIERYLNTKNLTTLEFLKLIDAFSSVAGRDNLTPENIESFNSLYAKIFQDEAAIDLINRFNNSLNKDEIDLSEFLTLLDLVVTYGDVKEDDYIRILNLVNRELGSKFSRFDDSPLFYDLINNIIQSNIENYSGLGGINYKSSYISMNVMGNVQTFTESYNNGEFSINFSQLDGDNIYGVSKVKLPYSGENQYYPDNLVILKESSPSLKVNEEFSVTINLPSGISARENYQVVKGLKESWSEKKLFKPEEELPPNFTYSLNPAEELRYGTLTLERVWLGNYSMLWEDERNWDPTYLPVNTDYVIFDGRAEDDCLVSGNVKLKNIYIDSSFTYLIKNFD